MLPIHGKSGKQYYAIKCSNQECREPLNLIEIPSQSLGEEQQVLEGQTIRCPMCTKETIILKRQIFVMAIR